MPSYKILTALKTAAFAVLLSAVAAPAAHSQDAAVPEGLQPTPAFGPMPEMSDMDFSTSKNPTRYQAGVRAYLNGKDDEAIADLEEAVRLDASDEKASRLLIKVYIRSINGNYQDGNRQKARALVQKARDRFPDNPEVKLLYSSVLENKAVARQEVVPERPDMTVARKSPPVRRAADPPLPAHAPAKIAQPPGLPTVSPQGTAPITAPAPTATFLRADPKAGSFSISYTGAIAVLFLALIMVIAFVYRQLSRQNALLLRVEELQRAMSEREMASASVRKELDIWKGFGKQVEELDLLRKTKEQVMYLELEKLKAQEERKLMADMAEKRREAERLARLEIETLAAQKAAAPASASAPEKIRPAAPKHAPKEAPAPIATREDKILEILADIAPPEREAAWERIAVQSAALYAEAPEEAVKFFRTIACDKNPLNRASIAGALAGIAAPETLDILMALYSDPGVEVRREALKRLNILNKDQSAGIDAEYRKKIAACLSEEKEKGEWVF